MRYTKTQSLYLSRKGVLPEIVDLFGMSNLEEVEGIDIETTAEDESPKNESEPQVPEAIVPEPETTPAQAPEDDIDSFFG